MNDLIRDEPTRAFWIVSTVALLWNLVGVMTYMMHVTLTPQDLAAMSAAQRALYTDAPAWVTGAYAIGVFGGTVGCIALLLRKSIALPILVVSLIGILAQMGYSLAFTNMLEVLGASSVVMPLLITVVGFYLVVFASGAKKRGIIG